MGRTTIEYFAQGGTGSFKSTETVNTIPQFVFVAQDRTNPYGAVRLDNPNAVLTTNGILGVNLSLGIDSQGNTTPQTPVNPGNPMNIFMGKGICPVQAAAVVINPGDQLYTSAALQGAVTNVATGNIALNAVAVTGTAGNAGELVEARLL